MSPCSHLKRGGVQHTAEESAEQWEKLPTSVLYLPLKTEDECVQGHWQLWKCQELLHEMERDELELLEFPTQNGSSRIQHQTSA